MLEVEISPLHIYFPSGCVNNNDRNLAPFIIRCVTGTVCRIPDDPSLRWDELWRSANGSDGQPPPWCPQVRWRGGGYHPKRGGDGAGGIQARSLALLNGWASLWGGLYSGRYGGMWEMLCRLVCGICILRCDLAGLQERSFLQKKLHQPEALFWGKEEGFESVRTQGRAEPSAWAECPWQMAGGRTETVSPECWLTGEIRLRGEEMGWGWSWAPNVTFKSCWSAIQHLLRILSRWSKGHFDRESGDALLL